MTLAADRRHAGRARVSADARRDLPERLLRST